MATNRALWVSADEAAARTGLADRGATLRAMTVQGRLPGGAVDLGPFLGATCTVDIADVVVLEQTLPIR